MDPIFPQGFFSPCGREKIAAEVIQKSLAQGGPSRRLFASYEKRVRKGLMFYWHVVENYYTTPFMDYFYSRANHHDLPSAVNAVLAGELEGGWKLRWRLNIFSCLSTSETLAAGARTFLLAGRAKVPAPAKSPQKFERLIETGN